MHKRRFAKNAAVVGLLAILIGAHVDAVGPPSVTIERMAEWTVASKKHYTDPFNDVDVDVIFSKDGQTWRVPTFWRGGEEWTVRFAPPVPGDYDYRLESTDKSNPDLNGHDGRVSIKAYSGKSVLLTRGSPKVGANKRYFEYGDGTPFYWLGDTWWMGFSSRLSWEGFKTLTADRKAKGFTVIQIAAGLVPFEESCPDDPGCQNEGGAVWTSDFRQINPKYFDYVDRRVRYLVDSDIAPAIVGAWNPILDQMDVATLKKHWRYIIARYGAYPVFWILGGEIFDPPEELAQTSPLKDEIKHPGAWTDVARYIRAIDPYHHLLAAHELSTDVPPLQQESLTDFRLFQTGHSGLPSVAVEVAQLNLHYARTGVTKPLVMGEINYEMFGQTYLEDIQRLGFWLATMNGAAGYTYGAAGTWESYTADKPFQRVRWSLLTWEEGMNLPGSSQIGLGAKLMRRYPWWKVAPHPEWITPHGTTLFEPRSEVDQFHIDLYGEYFDWTRMDWGSLSESDAKRLRQIPSSEWKTHNGDLRLPYAAGVPGEIRFVYIQNQDSPLPTILGLESGVRYRAFYWEPSLGVKVDLGIVERPPRGETLFDQNFDSGAAVWKDYGSPTTRSRGGLSAAGQMLSIVNGVKETNLVIAVDAHDKSDAGLVMRYRGLDNYLAAVYSDTEKEIYLIERRDGVVMPAIGRTAVSVPNSAFRLTAEVRDNTAIVSITSGGKTTSTPIVTVSEVTSGGAGLMCRCATKQSFEKFEVQKSPTLAPDNHLERKLYDAAGQYRGQLSGPGGPGLTGLNKSVRWDDYGRNKRLLLDSYQPELPPTIGDWLLVLDATASPTSMR